MKVYGIDGVLKSHINSLPHLASASLSMRLGPGVSRLTTLVTKKHKDSSFAILNELLQAHLNHELLLVTGARSLVAHHLQRYINETTGINRAHRTEKGPLAKVEPILVVQLSQLRKALGMQAAQYDTLKTECATDIAELNATHWADDWHNNIAPVVQQLNAQPA